MKQTDRQGQDGISFANVLRDCLVCGVIVVDSARKITLLTPPAEAILAIAGSPIGAQFESLPAPLQRLAADTMRTGQPLAPRKIKLEVNGEPRTLRVTVSPLASGKTGGVVLVLNDLTSANRMEEHVQHLDRLADIGTLAASMAHEIKNALVAGKTFVDLLLEKNQEGELVEVVRRELGRIDAIVSRMLRFAGPSPTAFAPLSLHEVLEHSLRLVQPQLESGGITLERTFLAEQDRINGADYELQQAFVNLLLNATEAMSAGGTLTVNTEMVAAGDQRAADEEAAARDAGSRQLRVSIKDTGAGISSENLQRLFEPFFTTKPTGTGLGLPITQRIIQEHWGEITVESQVGEGTTFQIILPVLE